MSPTVRPDGRVRFQHQRIYRPVEAAAKRRVSRRERECCGCGCPIPRGGTYWSVLAFVVYDVCDGCAVVVEDRRSALAATYPAIDSNDLNCIPRPRSTFEQQNNRSDSTASSP